MWPSTDYGDYNRSYVVEHAEIFRMVRDEGISGLTIVVGDKHSFWAGYTSETLPPRPFEPVGVEFVTGSISQAGAAEVQALTFPRDNPLRPFYVHDRPDGSTQCALNTTLLHGVRAALALRDTDDPGALPRLAPGPGLPSRVRSVPDRERAFAVSQRGHGDSERPAAGYRPQDFAADLTAFVLALDIGPAFIVGHSMGASIAQRFAIDQPQHTLGLVLVGSLPTWRNHPDFVQLWNSVVSTLKIRSIGSSCGSSKRARSRSRCRRTSSKQSCERA